MAAILELNLDLKKLSSQAFDRVDWAARGLVLHDLSEAA